MAQTDCFTPFTDPEIVAAYLQPVLERLALSFVAACDTSAKTFVDRGWSADAALSAYLIRKEVIEDLRAEGISIEEDDLELERKALCGLLLKSPLVHLKIRKSKDGEIPPAGSEQSLSFYNWNLLVFPNDEQSPLPLHLMLLWNDSAEGKLDTLLLACVEGDTWRWRIPVFQRDNSKVYKTSMRPEQNKADSRNSFIVKFDAGNEDVPLKLREATSSETSERSKEEISSVDNVSEEKKKIK